MRLRYEPLLSWPGALMRDQDREFSDFTAGWNETVELLEREAHALHARLVTIRLACPPSAFYKDGTGLIPDRKPPEHPGVVVVLDSATQGLLTYHTDRFRARGYKGPRESWRHNVRAVALALESLRRVERYGIADAGQQYAGWKEIGAAPMSAKPEPITLDQAAAILAAAVPGTPTAEILGDETTAKGAHRAALKLLHPDHGGSGDGARMALLAEAWELVKGHHRR